MPTDLAIANAAERQQTRLVKTVTDEFVKNFGKPLTVAAARHMDDAFTPGRQWKEIFDDLKQRSAKSRSGKIAFEMYKRFVFLLATENGYQTPASQIQ